ncbi:MAG TPA: molybdopterin-dependent oxidoreductase [Vicinamibacterales bacterium]|nr:molybdopterin-dependent oxidoreductase [Vicinamibacterales bacterium]
MTAPLLALWYLGSALAALPFAPFSLFDALSRILPGAALTLGIDVLVRVIGAAHLGRTAAAAKLAEQTIGVSLVLLGGVAGSAIAFGVARRLNAIRAPALTASAVIALVGWLPVLLMKRSEALTSGVWILGTMLLWGLALVWMYRRLHGPPVPMAADAPQPRLGTDRRRFLMRVGGAVAATTVAGVTVGARVSSRRVRTPARRWSSEHPLPNATDPILPVDGTRPELTSIDDHYRIDIDTLPPRIREADWRLRVFGLVDQPIEWSLDDVRKRQAVDRFITLSCISNPVGGDLIGTTRWTGLTLRSLLDEWAVKPSATHLRIRSADGYQEVVPLDLIRRDERLMLVHAWDGVPLPIGHGFPLRIYIPNVYGMKQPKWIQSIEAIDHAEPGYWVARGWDRDAVMKATSVIDTVRVGQPTTGGERMVSAGGIAHAGVRGISRVQVRADEGSWLDAQLREPLSPMTWTVWRAEFPLATGTHLLTVRCVDGEGAPQLTAVAPPHPSGASGLYRRSIKV